MGAKIIVVACNTATTNAIKHLRSTYQVPFIGIEPAIKPAALNTQTKCIGILATKGTLSSALFAETSSLYSSHIRVVEVVGTGLVQEIERGGRDSQKVENMLRELLDPMMKAGIDHLVLGCSHYPYLIPVLRKLLPSQVAIIDSGMAVARQTRLVLQSMDLLTDVQEPIPEFYTNGSTIVLRSLLTPFSEEIKVEHLDF